MLAPGLLCYSTAGLPTQRTSLIAFRVCVHLTIPVERDSSEWVLWEKEFTNRDWEIPKEILTIPLKDVFEVDRVGDPLAGDEGLCEPPDADVHGPGSRLRGQPGEVDGLLCECIALPALAFICGEPAAGVREGS